MTCTKSFGTFATALLLLSSSALAAIKTKPVEYAKGRDKFEGFLVYPDDAKGKIPGIVLVHNWLGVTDESKFQAERFAKLGYAVFVADIYGKGVRPKNPDEAGKLAGQYKGNRTEYRSRLNLALDTLKQQPNVDATKLAAVGYCFGGTGVMELARSGAPVKGVIGFHAGLDSPTPADGKNIKGKVLALSGGDDPYQKPEDLAAFKKEMQDAKVDWQLVQFGGAVHSFTEKGAGYDNSKGAAYNEKADVRSFADAQLFLKEIL